MAVARPEIYTRSWGFHCRLPPVCPSCPTSRFTSRRSSAASWAGVSIVSGSIARSSCDTYDPPLSAAEGKTVHALRRLGKRIAIGLSDELWLVMHLMIAGRLHWRAPHAKLAGKYNLAAFDFAGGTLLLTEAGAKRRAALYLVRGEHALAEHEPGGLDLFAASDEQFAAALRAENHTLKRALADPRLS